ncbi:50S ribosomal protein L35, chloroplastic [Diospyros lotus]|uniref:50S ribosomal protein L35, chloroplastic n=1 Tax=Diospyros lotus TaxID=55363 RepID=UPI0022595FC7|nr:50S ribosomal protein L35, chloroplastic [Diospyros lotus]
MASSTTLFSFALSFSSLTPSSSLRISPAIVPLPPFPKKPSLRLSSSHSLSGFAPLLPRRVSTLPSLSQYPQSLTIVSAKAYKMKTHKASAKRFRVTGSGKIMRRRAGKQHLLRKKNAKRRSRLSKMQQVDRSDYNNVIGALPYLKVNRQN